MICPKQGPHGEHDNHPEKDCIILKTNRIMKTKLYALALLMAGTAGAQAQNTPTSQMETLTRGAVSVPSVSGTGRFISWRLLGTDADNTVFDVLKDGKVLKSNIIDKTNVVDPSGLASDRYQIVVKQNGEEIETVDVTDNWTSSFKQIQLDRPESGKTPLKEEYTYSPNDCSVGDVDGDGEYELFVKWDPSNSKDNSQDGYTGTVYIDCYKMDGTKLWRVDLGQNIRAGAHYTQFLVYDFDGDGKAEMILKTAQGSKDGAGNYVSEAADDETIKTADNTKNWRNTSGKVTGGQEWLTVFDGLTGEAIHTVFYRPNRAPNSDGTPNWGGAPGWTFNWDDRSGKTDKEYGNRGERYLAAVAYLDGPDSNPSAVISRGYYTYAYVWAVDFDGSKLKSRWLSASTSKTRMTHYDADDNKETKAYTKATRGSGSMTMYGNGNHNLSVADVDGDGRDEIIWGSAALDDDGWLLYATGYGHGDAIHLSDLIPSRPGLEVFEVHEESPYGWDLHDAATGEILYSAVSAGDNGRGLAADIDANYEGFEFWSAAKDGVHNSVNGNSIGSSQPSTNFRIYWDGDPQDEMFDGGYSSSTTKCSPAVTKWNGTKATSLTSLSAGSSQTCNTTKATPCLQADLLGDWREEVVMWNGDDPSIINIFTTNIESSYRVPTLMHDHVYRMGIAWQNTAYNQPPHLGFYLPNLFTTRYVPIGKGAFEQSVNMGDSIETIVFKWANCANPSLYKWTAPDGTSQTSGAPEGFKFTRDTYLNKTITIEGAPQQIGTYEFIIASGKNVIDSSVQYDTIRIHGLDPSGIGTVKAADNWVEIANTQFNDKIMLTFNLSGAQTANIGIYSMSGAKVAGITHEAVNRTPLEIYGLSRLPAGVYLLKVDSREGTFTRKLLKR